ncbi:class I glutamine amidotransferase-like protein [Melampsora americana]|nr:class I glutamine amidotransferase-like protein [Melampsora americana]
MATASTINTDSAAIPLTDIAQSYDTILILDFGSQYSHLITRRCRELNVYCEMLPCTFKIKELKWRPKGVILSGSPYSVYEPDSPRVDPDVFNLGVPVLGICYGLQEIARTFGGKVIACDRKEYGSAMLDIRKVDLNGNPNVLFDGLGDQVQVWMSHGDRVDSLPHNFQILADTPSAPFAAISHLTKPIYGVQFHPEVTHSPMGKEIIQRFVVGVCQSKTDWTMETFIDKEIARIRSVVGPEDHVIGAVSGGVDSSVAAKLMNEAIGHRFHAIMVDNGLLRMNEADQVRKMLNEDLGVNLTVVDATGTFLDALKGIEDPEAKRKIIGNTFIKVFEAKAEEIDVELQKQAGSQDSQNRINYLLQGTLYPDVIESISFKGPSATIKTHHNVGGLLEDMKLKLIEPLRELFKDEVRALGRLLNIPAHLVNRHPFPGPGLAIRILGPITQSQLDIARKADAIYLEEIMREPNLYNAISQAFAVLLPVRAVGVQGDKRTYEQVIALRAVKTEDFMTADWFDFPPHVLRRISSRITNEVQGVNRVTYDISSKPPGTVEWL